MPSTKQIYGYPESDWEVFRELREVALERFCESVLGGTEAFRPWPRTTLANGGLPLEDEELARQCSWHTMRSLSSPDRFH